jgi:hypothetical protein
LFGVFRTVDLGQKYDKVPRVGGNFSFDIDTFITIIIWCITLGVICSSIFPSRLALVYSTRGIPMCVGLHPTLFLVLHYAGLFPATLYTRLIATGFLGARRFQHKADHPPPRAAYFLENLRPAPPPHPALADPLKAPP